MALRPREKYPANILTADAAYPWGKARNSGTPGDGTGTPLEEAWVNDLFGFQQALLGDAGITPSGNPDKVGSSQYLAALKVVVAKLRDIAGTWNADQVFGNIFLRGNTYIGSAYDGIQFEEDYPIRKKKIPLRPLADVTNVVGWVESNCQWATAGAVSFKLIVAGDVLPGGAIIRAVRVALSTSREVTLTATMYAMPASNNPAAPSAGTNYTDTHTPSGTEDFILTAVFPEITELNSESYFGESKQLRVNIDPASGGGSVSVRWAEVEFYDLLISNL